MSLTKFTATTAFILSAGLAQAEGELSIYHWFEYMPQELLDKFTAETGITVTMDTYDSNEAMLASLKAGGMGTYDVAVPGDYMVSIMKNEGMLDTIGADELTNRGNILPQWMDVDFDPVEPQGEGPLDAGQAVFGLVPRVAPVADDQHVGGPQRCGLDGFVLRLTGQRPKQQAGEEEGAKGHGFVYLMISIRTW